MRLTCRFTLLNAFLVYVFACNEGCICKIFSLKWFAILGELSGNMFLIHQMVIRYVNALEKMISPIDTIFSQTSAYSQISVYSQARDALITFFITLTVAFIWDRVMRSKIQRTCHNT